MDNSLLVQLSENHYFTPKRYLLEGYSRSPQVKVGHERSGFDIRRNHRIYQVRDFMTHCHIPPINGHLLYKQLDHFIKQNDIKDPLELESPLKKMTIQHTHDPKQEHQQLMNVVLSTLRKPPQEKPKKYRQEVVDKTSQELARAVREFHHASHRTPVKSLAEWKREIARRKGYNRGDFSVKDFLRTYLGQAKDEAEPNILADRNKPEKQQVMQQQELRTAANEKVVVTECKVPTEVLDALKKSSFERTPNDQRTLFTYMRGLKAFEKLSDFLLSEVLMVCRLQLFDAEAAVFRQGEVGTAWYIILWGSCKVLISKTGQLADSFHVATMHTGAGFGDLALVNDKPRTATIVTAAPCHLVVVEKSDYNKIIKVLHQSEQKEKLNFLRKIPFLKTWEEILLKPIATLSTVVPYQPNQTIIEQGQPSKNFYLVKKGTVHMMQNHSLPNGTVIKVKVNTLHETEYFGQEAALSDQPDKETSIATFVAGKKGCEVGYISVFDAKIHFYDDLLRNQAQMKTPNIEKCYLESIERKEWIQHKKKALNALAKEFYRDPNMNVKKWDQELNRKKKRWH